MNTLQELLVASLPKTPKEEKGNFEIFAKDFEEAQLKFKERYTEKGWKATAVLPGYWLDGLQLFRFFAMRMVHPATCECKDCQRLNTKHKIR